MICVDYHVMVKLINDDGNVFDEMFDINFIKLDQVYYRRLKLNKLLYGV